MAAKKETGKKGGFALAPITLSEPVRATDGFTNLVETPAAAEREEKSAKPRARTENDAENAAPAKTKPKTKREVTVRAEKIAHSNSVRAGNADAVQPRKAGDLQTEESEKATSEHALTESELLRILDADSLDEIYELTDVLRASSLKLYATLVRLADARGRTRVKNHELMSKAGIKGIATLYKQERWLMDLKLLEKKAKPGPHDGSSYVVHKLESLPLPAEIYDKFDEYLSGSE